MNTEEPKIDTNEVTRFYKGDGGFAQTESVSGMMEEYERGDVMVGEGSSLYTPLKEIAWEHDYKLKYDCSKGIAYCSVHGYTVGELARTFSGLVRRAFFNLELDPQVLRMEKTTPSLICEFVAANDLMVTALDLMGDQYEGGNQDQRQFTSMAWDLAYENNYWANNQDKYSLS